MTRPPPGWLPDPTQPGYERWWDGQQWSRYAHPISVLGSGGPLPGWYPDPSGPAQLRWWTGFGWAELTSPYPPPPGPALDHAIAAMKEHDPRPWGARPVLAPIAAYVVVILLGYALSVVAPSGGTGRTVFAVAVNIGIYAALVGAVVLAGRDIAARYGGWGPTFGWRRPRLKDLPPALAGIGITFALRIAVGVIAVAIAGDKVTREAQNLRVTHANATTAVLLLLLTVVMAPLIEELVFRGLLLRTFLQRWSFWPAAAASTVIFGLGHTYEVGTLDGAILLALSVGSLGIVNCVLVRRTDSLVPGMIVHASFNLLATIVLLTSVSSTIVWV